MLIALAMDPALVKYNSAFELSDDEEEDDDGDERLEEG